MSRLKQNLLQGWVDLRLDLFGPVAKWFKGKWKMSRHEDWMSRLNQVSQNWVDLRLNLFRPVAKWFKGKWEMSQRKDWMTRLIQVSQNWVDLGVDLSGPEGFASIHESTHRAKTSKNEFYNVLWYFLAFFVCNEYFMDENEWNWPIEWKWIDLIHEYVTWNGLNIGLLWSWFEIRYGETWPVWTNLKWLAKTQTQDP